MEGDIVLADEVIGPSRLVPPLPPPLRLPPVFGPLDAGREIADDGLEPNVDALVLVTLHRHGNAPLDIAGDGPRLQPLFQIVDGEVVDVGPPIGLVPHPLQQPLVEGWQVEEEVLRLPHHGPVAAEFADGLYKLGGVQRPAAGLTLVAAGVLVAAMGTGAVDVAIGQELAVVLAIELLHRPAVEMAPL